MANMRAYSAVRTNAHTGGGYYYVHVDIQEDSYDIATNTSRVTLTCRVLGRGYSRDGYEGGSAWSGSRNAMYLYLWDSKTNSERLVDYSEPIQAGKTTGGQWLGDAGRTYSTNLEHFEDGTLQVRARVYFDGWGYNYTPEDCGTQTSNLSLTNIPRASVATLDGDFHVSYGNDSDSRTVSLLKYVDTYYDELAITFSGVNYTDVELVNYGEIQDGDNITLDTSALNILYPHSNWDILLDDGDGHKYYELELVVSTYEDNTKEVLVGTKKTTVKIFITGLEPTLTSIDFTSSTSGIAGNNIVKDNSNIHLKYVISIKGYSQYDLDTTIGDFDVYSLIGYSDGIGIDLEKTSVTNYDLHYVDSRGLVLDVTNRKTLIEYNKLTAMGSSKRHQPTDNKIEIILDGLFWNENFGISNNNLTIKYKLWKANETEPTSWTGTICNAISQSTTDVTIQNGRYHCDFVTSAIYDYKSIYKLKVQVNDLLTTLTPERTISRGIPVFYWTAKDLHIGEVGDDSKLYLNGQEISSQPTITPSQQINSSTTDIPSNNAVKTFVESFGTIQEVGDANGGHYIKYTNGIMICTKAISGSVSIKNSGVMVSSWSTGSLSLGAMPANFVSVWSEVAMAAEGWGTSVSMFVTAGITGDSTSSMGSLIVVRPSGTATATVYAKVIAIGTWK